MLKRYSVGDFASKLGVTSSFIKYYEKQGILKPEIQNAGYRYYTVRSIPLILDIIKWKNMSFPAKEIVELMQETRFNQLYEQLTSNRVEIKRQMKYLQGVLDYIDQMRISQEGYMRNDNWELGYYGDFYFLPTHTNQAVIADKDTSNLIHAWLRYIPVAQSTAKVDDLNGETDIIWGLSVPRPFAEEMNIPVGEKAEYVPRKRALCVYDRRLLPDQEDEMPDDNVMGSQMCANVRRIAKLHNLRISGSSFFTIQSKVRENEHRYSYQRIITPIE